MEYNELTKRLLAEGYTADHHPDYVQVDTSRLPGNDPLNNLSGGFEYKRFYRDSIVYKTGCGKFIMGSHVIDNLGCGIDWSHENDNPVFRCPYNKPECEHNDPRLYGTHGGGLCLQCFCTCHKTDEPYNYEISIEKANREREEERKRKYREYSNAHGGRVCENHMYYDERTNIWTQRYNPIKCAKMCAAHNGYCPILGRQLSRKRGNVYYDLRKSGTVRHEAQMSLFEKDRWESIKKGIRFLDHPCSMDICEAIVKTSQEDIRWHYEINNSFEKLEDETFTWEIYNIRAESKPSRDLMQDLQDLREGVEIIWEDDQIKEDKERKKKKKQEAKQKAIDRLEKKLIEIGYENLPDTSIDRVHTDKWLDSERLEELENIRQQKIKEEQEKPVQLSLFDLL